MMMKTNLAIVGATGLVGQTILSVLKERSIDIDNLYLFASRKSAGSVVDWNDQSLTVLELAKENIVDKKIDYVFFAASGDLSKVYTPIFVEAGAVVIDNSSHFRMDPKVPLVVPEVNPQALVDHKGIIANPNCSTIQSVLALKPIEDLFKIKRIVYSTYQAVSGSGLQGIRDLEENVVENYPYSINNNILPHIDDFLDSGYTKEEVKMMDESKKIFGRSDLKLTATTARVPIKNTHAVSINVECFNPINLEALKEVYQSFPGIKYTDKLKENIYPLAEDADGDDFVYVGRLRLDESVDHGLNLWCVTDNIRKGAASNSVDIFEELVKQRSDGNVI